MRIRWFRSVGALIGLICLMGNYSLIFGKEIVVEELSISLYNKPVTGFRFTLDRSERFVANQIIEHVAAAEETSPFQYERSIIWENIRYTPIADDRDLSLYYLLKSIEGQFTEVTFVVMYDYRRSVNSREFADLALKLKIDIAKLVRHTSGDVVRCGDLLLDDAAIAKLSASPTPIAATNTATESTTSDRFKREEVANDGVLLRKDPFKSDNKQVGESHAATDTALQRLNARIQALEAREQELMATERNLRNEQATMQRQNEIMLGKVKENKRLHDSITLLSERVEALIGQAYVADDVSVSNETAMELMELEKENKRLGRQQVKLETENDSLVRVAIRYSEQLTRLSAGGKSTAEQMAVLTRENEDLRGELQEYKAKFAIGLGDGQGNAAARAAVADSLLDLLARAQVKNATLQEEAEINNRNLGRLKEENDFLSGKKMQLEERITSLEAENRNLRQGNQEVLASLPNENLIDSLNGEIRTARRAAGTAKAELTQLKADMETLQKAKDSQERQLVTAQTEQKRLQSRIAQLEGSPAGITNPGNPGTDDASVMADSLRLLRQQLKLAESKASEATASKDALAKAQADLSTRDRELRKAQTDLNARTTELAEAQKAKGALQKSLQDAEARLSENGNARTASQQELDRLKQENRSLSTNLSTKDTQLGKVTAENKTLSDSIAANRQQRAALQRDIIARDRSLRQQIEQRDSIQNLLSGARNREKDIRRNLAEVQARVDSLARVRVPEGAQAQFLKEQRARLDQQEKDLVARDLATTDKEKLLAQRESVLQRKEADNAAQTTRFKDLEERERRVQLLEQQLNAREGSPTIDANTPITVREGRVVEFGNHVPVFIVESPLEYKMAQKQTVGFMLSRNELFDDRFPELLYRAANISELDAGPIEMKVRIDARGTGTILQISFRLADGEYLGGEKYRERSSAAKQLISKMLRYKV